MMPFTLSALARVMTSPGFTSARARTGRNMATTASATAAHRTAVSRCSSNIWASFRCRGDGDEKQQAFIPTAFFWCQSPPIVTICGLSGEAAGVLAAPRLFDRCQNRSAAEQHRQQGCNGSTVRQRAGTLEKVDDRSPEEGTGDRREPAHHPVDAI